jgi:methyl-accepting chemotaxis protein
MDQMTQQNAALVEESAAASRTLQEEAQTMYDRMSAFSVDDGVRPDVKTAPARSGARKVQGKSVTAGSPSKPVQGRASKATNGAAYQPQPADLEWREF